jgi:MinD-like ATPase involved in chromosome partitioning or flagellar assembly
VPLAEPHDQASGLRRLFTAGSGFRGLGLMGPDPRATARATLLLARALARRGDRVLVLDEAPPPHNVGGLLGLTPRRDLTDLPRLGLDAAERPAGEEIALLPARSGLAFLSALDERDLADLTDNLAAQAPEWMLLNAGDDGGDLAAAAELRILVLPLSRARLADAYAVLKAAHAASEQGIWLVLAEADDAQAARALHDALARTAQRFLGLEPHYLGCLGAPAPRRGAEDEIAQDLAETLAGLPLAQGADFARAWQRMWLHSRTRAARPHKDNKVTHGNPGRAYP